MTALTLALLLIAGPAPKKEAPGKDVAKAKELVQLAQKLYKQARYQEAIAKFEDAYAVKPHPVIFFNIGKCWEQLGEPGKAMRAYKDYLRLMPDAPDKDTVTDAIANLERRLKAMGVQQLMVFAEPASAEIEIDGKPLGSSPASVELPAGTHRLKVAADGFETIDRSFVVSIAHSNEMTLTLRPKSETPAVQAKSDAPVRSELIPPPPPTGDEEVTASAESKSKPRIFTWVAGGVAVVGLGTGAALGAMANDSANKLATSPSNRTRATADGYASDARGKAAGANVSYGIAAAAAATAVVLFFLEGR